MFNRKNKIDRLKYYLMSRAQLRELDPLQPIIDHSQKFKTHYSITIHNYLYQCVVKSSSKVAPLQNSSQVDSESAERISILNIDNYRLIFNRLLFP